MSPGLRIGVFGGAFDPPHLAHLALARLAVEQLQLDELLVFPTGQAWHKSRPLSAADHRLAMTRLAFADVPKAHVDDRELRREGPTYTIDTLEALQVQAPNCALFLVIGSDQAEALSRWHRWTAILKIATICVAVRAQQESATSRFGLKTLSAGTVQDARGPDPLPASLPDGLSDSLAALPDSLASLRSALGRFEWLRLPPMAMSATGIRQRVAAGEAIDDLVTEPVARYIALHHLYLPD